MPRLMLMIYDADGIEGLTITWQSERLSNALNQDVNTARVQFDEFCHIDFLKKISDCHGKTNSVRFVFLLA